MSISANLKYSTFTLFFLFLFFSSAQGANNNIRVFATKTAVDGAFGDVVKANEICSTESKKFSSSSDSSDSSTTTTTTTTTTSSSPASSWKFLFAKKLPTFQATTNSLELSKMQSRFPNVLPTHFQLTNLNGEVLGSSVDELFDSNLGGTRAPLLFSDKSEVTDTTTFWTGASSSGSPTGKECFYVVKANPDSVPPKEQYSSNGQCSDPEVDETIHAGIVESLDEKFAWSSKSDQVLGTASRIRRHSESSSSQYSSASDSSSNSEAPSDISSDKSASWLDSFDSTCDKEHHLLCVEFPEFPKNENGMTVAKGRSIEEAHPRLIKLVKNPEPTKNCVVESLDNAEGRLTENYLCCLHRGLTLKINNVLTCQSKGPVPGSPLRLTTFASENLVAGKACFSGCYFL